MREQIMKTMTARGVIAPDGKLRLEVATDLPPGPAEVVVVVQPSAPPEAGLASLAGALAGKMPAGVDIIKEVRAIRRRATKDALEIPE
jgi:hypothetical protein